MSAIKTTSKYDLRDLLNLLKKEIALSINCHAIGTIQGVNLTNQTVKVSINYLKVFNNPDAQGNIVEETKNYSALVDCPFVVLQGGSAALTFPVAVGDTCLILFNDRDMDQWFASGQVVAPPTARLHSFSDAIALVGIRSAVNSISSYDSTRAVLRYGTTKVGVGSSKVLIENQIGTLNDILSDFITVLQALVIDVSGATGTVNAASVTALTAIATRLGALLD